MRKTMRKETPSKRKKGEIEEKKIGQCERKCHQRKEEKIKKRKKSADQAGNEEKQ